MIHPGYCDEHERRLLAIEMRPGIHKLSTSYELDRQTSQAGTTSPQSYHVKFRRRISTLPGVMIPRRHLELCLSRVSMATPKKPHVPFAGTLRNSPAGCVWSAVKTDQTTSYATAVRGSFYSHAILVGNHILSQRGTSVIEKRTITCATSASPSMRLHGKESPIDTYTPIPSSCTIPPTSHRQLTKSH